MRLIIAVLCIVSHLPPVAASFKSCTDALCKECTTEDAGPDTCIQGMKDGAAAGNSGKYICNTDNVTVFGWSNTDCSENPIVSFTVGAVGKCYTVDTRQSFLVTCAAGALGCYGWLLSCVALAMVGSLL